MVPKNDCLNERWKMIEKRKLFLKLFLPFFPYCDWNTFIVAASLIVWNIVNLRHGNHSFFDLYISNFIFYRIACIENIHMAFSLIGWGGLWIVENKSKTIFMIVRNIIKTYICTAILILSKDKLSYLYCINPNAYVLLFFIFRFIQWYDFVINSFFIARI